MSDAPVPPPSIPPNTPHEASRPGVPSGGLDTDLATVVFALVFLYYGFGSGLVGTSSSAFYNGSVAAFVWMARAVGVGMLAELAARRMAGAAIADRLDLVVGVVAAGGCVIIGGIWIAYADWSGLLLLAFGVYNATVVRGSWQRVAAHREPRA